MSRFDPPNESDGSPHVPPKEDDPGPVVMRKGTPYFKTTVELDRRNVELFRVFYPQHGALKDFFNKCLDKFVQIHESTEDKDITTAVNETMEEMGEGEENA